MAFDPSPFRQLLLPALASAIVVCAGATSLWRTNISGTAADLFDGSYQRAIETRFKEALPFSTLAAQGWNALRIVVLNEASAGALIGTKGTLFTTEEFVMPQGAPVFKTALLEAKDNLNARGVQLVPVIVPDKARVLSDAHKFPRAREIETRYQRVLEIIEAAGLPVLLVADDLHAFGAASYYRTDTHWSPEGAQRVARLIADTVPSLVDPKGRFTTTQTGTSSLEGDLARFVETGPFRNLIGQRPELRAHYETRNDQPGLGLFGEAEITIHLVGTSFSAREDIHFDGFLKSTLGRDVLNLAEQGQGPFQPMAAYLESETLGTTPPEFVIWEIPERYINPRRLK